MVEKIRVVDAHQHLWDLGSGGYSWLGPELEPINRSFGYEEAEPLAAAAGVDDVVLVQADNTVDDTEAMLTAAQQWSRVCGVVGWLPLDDAETRAPLLERFAADPLLVGVRHLNHDEADPHWIARDEVGRGLTDLAARGLTFDVVAVIPEQIGDVPALAKAHPSLSIVVDHLATPPIAAGGWEPWADQLAAAAALPNVSAKLSGLGTTADPANCTADALRRYVDHALEQFGADRLMFGSDWPVSCLAGGYEFWWSLVQDLVAPLSHGERSAVLGDNARRIYGLAES